MLSLTNILLNTSDSTGAALLAAGEHLVQNIAEDGSVVMEAVKSNYGGVVSLPPSGCEAGHLSAPHLPGRGRHDRLRPLLANPKSILLGGAAQLGIFGAFFLAILLGFTPQEAGSIGIIGGATVLPPSSPRPAWPSTCWAPSPWPPTPTWRWSPVIQPPIMKALTTKKERQIVMRQLRPVSKTEKIIFPIAVTTLVGLVVPSTVLLLGMLMLGNLMKECGVVEPHQQDCPE